MKSSMESCYQVDCIALRTSVFNLYLELSSLAITIYSAHFKHRQHGFTRYADLCKHTNTYNDKTSLPNIELSLTIT